MAGADPGATGAHAPSPVSPAKKYKKEGEKNDKRKKGGKRKKVSMSDGCSMPSFLVVGCSIRASLTCLFFFKSNNGRGTPYPPPLRCLARRLAILIGHQHTVPSLLVVGSSIPSFLVVGCSIRASFTCLIKKNFERREGDTPSHTLPRLGASTLV